MATITMDKAITFSDLAYNPGNTAVLQSYSSTTSQHKVGSIISSCPVSPIIDLTDCLDVFPSNNSIKLTSTSSYVSVILDYNVWTSGIKYITISSLNFSVTNSNTSSGAVRFSISKTLSANGDPSSPIYPSSVSGGSGNYYYITSGSTINIEVSDVIIDVPNWTWLSGSVSKA